VIARGIERRPIFSDDRDRGDFLSRVARIFPECGTGCFAWALMPNHVHMVLRTGDRPLATVMARLLTGYAKRFNERHERVGHLFQNRYLSLFADDDDHLLTLVRYVHLNPVKGGIVTSVDELAAYPWTGHSVLMGRCRAPFQSTAEVLAAFSSDTGAARKVLERWMTDEDMEQSEPSRDAASILEGVVSRVCRELGIGPAALLVRPAPRRISGARARIAYLASEAGVPLVEVARRLGMSASATSRARRRGSPAG
jgi:REP element-mobilizing transposase RayT